MACVIDHADERYIGALRKVRVALDLRAQRLPILGKAIDENRALGIADIQDGHLLRAGLQGDVAADLASFKHRRAHVHFEPKLAAIAAQQAQMLWPGAGEDGDFTPLALDQSAGRSAARAVAGDFSFATVGIEQPNGVASRLDIHPSAPMPV